MFGITESDKEKVLASCFISEKPLRLAVFPAKEKKKYITLLFIVESFAKERYYTEKEVNQVLSEIYVDFATIRRYLVDYGFLGREKDGSRYWVKDRDLSEAEAT